MWRNLTAVALVLAAIMSCALGAIADPATPQPAGETFLGTPEAPSSPLTEPDETAVATVRIMTFNIWIGGQQVDLSQVTEAVRQAGADVVGIQEAEGAIPRLASALDWSWYDERQQVISRYPLIDPPGANGAYLFVEPEPGQVFAVANVHLPSDPYGPEAVRDGATLDDVLTIERETRMPMLQARLDALAPLLASGIPTFLTGDFNAPSLQDWTTATMTSRAAVRFPVEWPTSASMIAAGFTDSYRSVHPDAVEKPGLTWTPGYPSPLLRPNETFDRIDFVWSAGSVTPLGSEIVGEADGADVDIPLTPFPSDHRAVVSTFSVQMATPPAFAAVERRSVTIGDPLVVRFHAYGAEGERIALLPAGGSLDETLLALAPRETYVDGSVTFGTGTLPPGSYDGALVSQDDEIISRSPVQLLSPGATPSITGPIAPVSAGTPIEITYANAPGARWDWIALYADGDPDLLDYLTFTYTEAGISGTVALDTTGLEPGAYTVRLLLDDGYELLAETRVVIVP